MAVDFYFPIFSDEDSLSLIESIQSKYNWLDLFKSIFADPDLSSKWLETVDRKTSIAEEELSLEKKGNSDKTYGD